MEETLNKKKGVSVRENGKTNGHARRALQSKLTAQPTFLEEKDYSEKELETAVEDHSVVEVARADFPTRFGRFTIVGFHDSRGGKEHTAIVGGDVAGRWDVPVRIHSECHTGDVWGSLRCDCREQLEAAIRYIAAQPFGAVIYLKQEGRGIGLLNKLKAYHLQDLGLDTIEANEYLGFPEDARDYRVAARILELLGIQSVVLLTNNPDKIDGLEREGVEVAARVPVVIEANPHNAGYLAVKKSRMGHMI
jgi:GTP cyclohydrolase II